MGKILSKLFAGKRKLIFFSILILVLIGSSLALAKPGLFKILADEISLKGVGRVQANVSSTTMSGGSANGQTVRLYQTSSPSTSADPRNEIDHRTISGVVSFNLTVGYYYVIACDNSPISPAMDIYPDGNTSSISVGVTCPNVAVTATPTATITVSRTAVPLPEFRMTGNIYDENNLLIRGATVKVVDRSISPATTITEIKSLAEGTFDSRVYRTNYFPRANLNNLYVEFSGHDSVSGLDYIMGELDLSKQASITNRIIDAEGETDVLQDIILIKPHYPNTQTIDFQGKVVGVDDKPIQGVQVQLHCSYNFQSFCYSIADTNQTVYSDSVYPFQKSNGLERNYLKNFGYNINKAGAVVTSLSGSFAFSSQYYHDINNDDKVDSGETGSFIFTVRQGDIHTPLTADSKSYLVLPELKLKVKPVVSNAVIRGKLVDEDNRPIPNNNVYGKKGGYQRPWDFTASDSLSPFDFNAVTKNDGTYEILISPEQVSGGGDNVDFCAHVDHMPYAAEIRNWGCYGEESRHFKIERGKTYENIDIKIPHYSVSFDDTKIGIVGVMSSVTEYFGMFNVTAKCNSGCGQGPWSAGPPEALNGVHSDFTIADVANISKSGSAANRLYVYPPKGSATDWYMDTNGNGINDDQQYIEITPSDIISKAFVNIIDDKLYYFVDLHLRPKVDFVNIIGTVKDESGNWIPGVKIEAQNRNFTEMSQAVSDIPPDQYGETKANFIFSTLKYSDFSTWNITIKPPLFMSVKSPTADIQIKKTDLQYDQTGKFYYYKADYVLQASQKDLLNLYFFTIESGEEIVPIDLTKEKIKYLDLTCTSKKDNAVVDCAEIIPRVASDEKNLRKYYLDDGRRQDSWVYDLKVETDNYIYDGTGRLNFAAFPASQDIILIDKRKANYGIQCRIINSIEFCFNLTISPDSYVSSHPILSEIATIVKGYTDRADANKKYPLVYIREDDSGLGADVVANTLQLGTQNQSDVIRISDEQLSTSTMIHEMSHVLDNLKPIISQSTLALLKNTFQSAKNSKCADEPLYRKALTRTGEGGDADYGLRNENEFKAVFFNNWLIQNDIVKAAMADDSGLKLECRIVLKNLYTILNTRFPNLPLYQEIANRPKAAVSTMSTGKSAATFESIMIESGYAIVPRVTFSTIANPAYVSLTPKQVAAGALFTENFNQLPLVQRVNIKLNILKNTAINIISRNISVAQMRNLLSSLNSQAEALLGKLRINITATEVSGIVADQDGPVPNLSVEISGKTDVTDLEGRFKISRIPSGYIRANVKNIDINKTYPVINANWFGPLADNEKKTNMIFRINRPVYRFQGKVANRASQPLANGKIIISNGNIVNLNSVGRFNFTLKEGAYRLSFRAKNNVGRLPALGGDFGNLPILKAIKNINGTITVK
jgi:hypothetical protein